LRENFNEFPILIVSKNSITKKTSNVGPRIVLKFNPRTGKFLGRFDQNSPSNFTRPYGIAFYNCRAYIASFMSDQIFTYDENGDFLAVFAQGNQQPGGLNGPDDLLFDVEGNLYVTTEGSVGLVFGLPSEVLVYNISTKTSNVFVPEPTPIPPPDGQGYVSELGLAWGPYNNLYVSDFANDIRVYNRRELLNTLLTNYTSGPGGPTNQIGYIAFVGDHLYATSFDPANQNASTILQWNLSSGCSSGCSHTFLFQPNTTLNMAMGLAVSKE